MLFSQFSIFFYELRFCCLFCIFLQCNKLVVTNKTKKREREKEREREREIIRVFMYVLPLFLSKVSEFLLFN